MIYLFFALTVLEFVTHNKGTVDFLGFARMRDFILKTSVNKISI